MLQSVPSSLILRTTSSMRGRSLEEIFTGAPLQQDAMKGPTGQSLMIQVNLVLNPSSLILQTASSMRGHIMKGLFTDALLQRDAMKGPTGQSLII